MKKFRKQSIVKIGKCSEYNFQNFQKLKNYPQNTQKLKFQQQQNHSHASRFQMKNSENRI